MWPRSGDDQLQKSWLIDWLFIMGSPSLCLCCAWLMFEDLKCWKQVANERKNWEKVQFKRIRVIYCLIRAANQSGSRCEVLNSSDNFHPDMTRRQELFRWLRSRRRFGQNLEDGLLSGLIVKGTVHPLEEIQSSLLFLLNTHSLYHHFKSGKINSWGWQLSHFTLGCLCSVLMLNYWIELPEAELPPLESLQWEDSTLFTLSLMNPSWMRRAIYS